jgi:6,7-dimethyl-8-ribityllumazine synthase
MSSALKNLSSYSPEEIPNGKEFEIGIVVSEWNTEITHALANGCLETLHLHGVPAKNIKLIHVPGAFELPAGAKILITQNKYDSVICLGCVIKGDTNHDEYINSAVANGLTQLSLLSSTPCIFGLLTVNSLEQAQDRAGGKHGNKGTEAAVTALKMADLKKNLLGSKAKIGF